MRLKCQLFLSGFSLDIDVTFESQVTAVFGPSGAGKTSLLDAIAGLRQLSSGEIEIGGRVLFSSSRGIDLSPRQRWVGYVPQEAALFPHLSVKKNILFGTHRRENPPATEAATLEHVTRLLEISHLLDRSVTALSGGEGQRVALARAILSRPQLLLLDEPLASLDIGLKERIIPYLKRVREEYDLPILYVSHDPIEVLGLADWVIMLREGRIVTQGLPQAVLMSAKVLPFLDRDQVENVFDGLLTESDREGGRSRVRLDSGQELFIPYTEGPANRLLRISIRGDDILVARRYPEEISAANVLKGRIRGMQELNGQSLLEVEAGSVFYVRVTSAAVRRLKLEEGLEVFLVIKARSCLVV